MSGNLSTPEDFHSDLLPNCGKLCLSPGKSFDSSKDDSVNKNIAAQPTKFIQKLNTFNLAPQAEEAVISPVPSLEGLSTLIKFPPEVRDMIYHRVLAPGRVGWVRNSWQIWVKNPWQESTFSIPPKTSTKKRSLAFSKRECAT